MPHEPYGSRLLHTCQSSRLPVGVKKKMTTTTEAQQNSQLLVYPFAWEKKRYQKQQRGTTPNPPHTQPTPTVENKPALPLLHPPSTDPLTQPVKPLPSADNTPLRARDPPCTPALLASQERRHHRPRPLLKVGTHSPPHPSMPPRMPPHTPAHPPTHNPPKLTN